MVEEAPKAGKKETKGKPMNAAAKAALQLKKLKDDEDERVRLETERLENLELDRLRLVEEEIAGI